MKNVLVYSLNIMAEMAKHTMYFKTGVKHVHLVLYGDLTCYSYLHSVGTFPSLVEQLAPTALYNRSNQVDVIRHLGYKYLVAHYRSKKQALLW